MDERGLGPFERTDPELIEREDDAASAVRPVLLRPVASVRSPILEHRPIEARAPGQGRPGLTVPPVRALIGPLIWAIVPASLVLVLSGPLPAIVLGLLIVVIRASGRRVGLSNISFADGFLPYRPDDGWPRGVQEEDVVHWNLAPLRNAGAGGGVRD
jgi:hypothetical protein